MFDPVQRALQPAYLDPTTSSRTPSSPPATDRSIEHSARPMPYAAFLKDLTGLGLEDAIQRIERSTIADVERVVASGRVATLDDLAALVSPAAHPLLETIAQEAHRRSLQRHGRVVVLYAPLYLSNFCVNHCIYCGFKAGIKKIRRHTLSLQEIDQEAARLRELGFRHVLLVSGEEHNEVPVDYMCEAIRICRRHVDSVSIEFESLPFDAYKSLVAAGCDGMALYQETYHPATYKWAHPGKGPKSDYANRIDAPDRAARAGMRSLGIGALLGLADWRFDVFALWMHARYLMRHNWQTRVSISFPRLRDETGGFRSKIPVHDRQFVQIFLALRLALPDRRRTAVCDRRREACRRGCGNDRRTRV